MAYGILVQIEIERGKIPEENIATELRRVWIQRRSFIEGEGKRLVSTFEPLYPFEEMALGNESDKRLFRDCDRMLKLKTSRQQTSFARDSEIYVKG